MLTYSIRPKTVVQNVLGAIYNWPMQAVKQLGAPSAVRMGKWEYSKYIDGVKAKFHENDLITLHHVPEQTNRKPVAFIITYIEEMWNNVKYDDITGLPLCLTCRVLHGGVVVQKTPAAMRLLTDRELELVYLSNSSAVN